MKKIIFALVMVALLLPVRALAGDVSTRLVIDDMHCALWVPAIAKALKQVAGVKTVQVSLDDKQAVVTSDETVEPSTLIAAVAKASSVLQTASPATLPPIETP